MPVRLKDENGRYHYYSSEDIVMQLAEQSMHMFGMDFRTILEMRRQLLLAGFSLPITTKKVTELFNEKKVN